LISHRITGFAIFFNEEENTVFQVVLFIYLDMQSFIFFKTSSKYQATMENILACSPKAFSQVALHSQVHSLSFSQDLFFASVSSGFVFGFFCP